MIELYKFVPQFGIRDASPFALKLETYLRLAGLDFESIEIMSPVKAPKAKIPYIIDGDQTIADSSLCIGYLKDKYGDKLGKNLSLKQHAIGHAVKTMLEERTYWVMVNMRWMDEDKHQLMKETWFDAIPALIRGLIFKKIIKDMAKGMYAHGIGRHTDAEIMAFGLDDLAAFEAVLGDKPYLLGDVPSEYDATGYGFLANFMAEQFPSPLSEYIAGSKTLIAYIDRVEKKAFG
ncbi:MAG: glutathione S-transferase family protein [Robiginitomaculum sp.]|nr:glutathione S-transferase family protein [Robiginitomaculum sp.]